MTTEQKEISAAERQAVAEMIKKGEKVWKIDGYMMEHCFVKFRDAVRIRKVIEQEIKEL